MLLARRLRNALSAIARARPLSSSLHVEFLASENKIENKNKERSNNSNNSSRGNNKGGDMLGRRLLSLVHPKRRAMAHHCPPQMGRARQNHPKVPAQPRYP